MTTLTHNLFHYRLFTNILRTAYDASEIEFKEDGSWAPSKERDDLELCDSPDPEAVQMIGKIFKTLTPLSIFLNCSQNSC